MDPTPIEPNAEFNDLGVDVGGLFTGHIHGYLAGPNAEEAGGRFHLSEVDGPGQLVGSFGTRDINLGQ